MDHLDNWSNHMTVRYIAYGLRSNDQWESYDDLKEQVIPKSNNFKVNVEILFYTM